MNDNTEAATRRILASVCRRDESAIGPDANLSDLGLDSLDRVLLAVLIEEASGRAVPDDLLVTATTVADIRRLFTHQEAA